MSCESKSNKVVALARKVGIPHLSGKKAFYAGLLVAASQASVLLATLGLLAAIKAKASGNESPGQEAPGGNDRKPVAIVTPQDIPALPSRRAITPAAPQALSGKTCSNCSASPKSKPGLWYVIDEDAYCQDCAPRAAREADVDLAVPSGPGPTTPGAGQQHGDNLGSRQVPATGFRAVLESADPESIRLEEGAVDIRSANGRIRIPRGAYYVLRKDGTSTGLAITPWVEKKQGELVTAPDSWVITHLSSGLAMTQPYSSAAEARILASILAQIDWRRPTEAISRREMEATRQVIKSYNETLAEAKARKGDRALAGSFMQTADLFQHSS